VDWRGAMGQIKWGQCITRTGKVIESTVSTIIGWPSRIPEPNTFPYGSAEDLDELGGKINRVLIESDPDPYDFERIGRRRRRVLISSEQSARHFDPAEAHSVADKVEELWKLINEHPELKDDPEMIELVAATVNYARLMAAVIDIVDPRVTVHADQLALEIGM